MPKGSSGRTDPTPSYGKFGVPKVKKRLTTTRLKISGMGFLLCGGGGGGGGGQC
jgi:hypothetical protein